MRRVAWSWGLSVGLVAWLGGAACSKSTPPAEPPPPQAQARAFEQGPQLEIAIAEAETAPELSDQQVVALLEDPADEPRYWIPPALAAPASRGRLDAPVTISLFFDYQCPYSKRLNDVLNDLVAQRPDQVRVVYRHLPLPMHRQAKALARASVAATELGVFDVMHDRLFEISRSSQIEAELDQLASDVGVDPAVFRSLRNSSRVGATVDEETRISAEIGVRSTPSFFVNGKAQRGARPAAELRAIVDAEVARTDRLIAAGVARSDVYARVRSVSKVEPVAKPKPSTSARPGRPEPTTDYAVPVAGRPVRGPDDALVTIVEWGDFECPFTSRVQATLRDLQKKYPREVRLVFRHNPLAFHKNAEAAAKAAWAAGRQGKFWEMHDKLFERQRGLDDAVFRELAKGLRLDLRRFDADRNSAAAQRVIDEDKQVAATFGARGTPSFFINGRFLSGAQPLANFVDGVQAQLPEAQALLRKRGGRRGGLYEALIAGFETKVAAPAAKPVADNTRRQINTTGMPRRGPAGARVQIVMCGDFDDPFSKRAVGTLDQLDKKYPGQIALYFAHWPLPMHKNAKPAHRFAWAAHQQGRFWDAWRMLFDRSKQRTDTDFRQMAVDLGLSWSRARSDSKAIASRADVQRDVQTCKSLGARGAPTFYINGRMMAGAQPIDRFASVVDEELAR